jgi:hypothetical protein
MGSRSQYYEQYFLGLATDLEEETVVHEIVVSILVV